MCFVYRACNQVVKPQCQHINICGITEMQMLMPERMYKDRNLRHFTQYTLRKNEKGLYRDGEQHQYSHGE